MSRDAINHLVSLISTTLRFFPLSAWSGRRVQALRDSRARGVFNPLLRRASGPSLPLPPHSPIHHAIHPPTNAFPAQASDKMKTLNKEFASLHGISTSLNFVAMGGLIFHALVRRSFPGSCFSWMHPRLVAEVSPVLAAAAAAIGITTSMSRKAIHP